ncbi:MAG: glycoside hydrolase family 2 TIM barrel-domain containing protein, partial [Cytophagaceae bacterium]
LEEGHLPLTRSILSRDFKLIKAMGANTIRRYNQGVYDVNVLNIAEEYDLKVCYSIWFDPKTDFANDVEAVKEYQREAEELVTKYKNKKSVLAWTLGGPVWNMLQENFRQPYLTEVRRAYLQQLEEMAKTLHRLDPHRPVIAVFDFTDELPAALLDLKTHAPSIDVIGLNVYKEQDLMAVPEIIDRFYPGKPYLFTEFGPQPYAFDENNGYEYKEDTDFFKGRRYFWKWIKYIDARKETNLGGFAFCWSDKADGVNTWFGLTDFKGRRKASYYDLMRVWGGKKMAGSFPQIYIEGPEKGFIRGSKHEFDLKSLDGFGGFKHVDWYLCKEEKFKESGKIDVAEDRYSLLLKIPVDPGKYRLYAFLSDKNGNVVTASKAIYIK